MDRTIVLNGRRRITVVMATTALIAVALTQPFAAAAASPTPIDAASADAADVDVIVRFKTDPGIAARSTVRTHGGDVSRRLELIDGLAASVPATELAALRKDPLVASVEIDGRIEAFDHAAATGDLEYENAWGVEHIGTFKVHQAGIKGEGVKVAVIDTGLDYVHDVPPNVDPEFLGNYRGGYDFINGDSDPMDDNGHGTHVAGILAAEHNGYLVVGVAPKVDLYALKVLDASGSGEYSGLIAALGWAVDHDMDVVNMSLGGNEASPALQAAIAAAYDAGVTLVAASGNAVSLNDLIYGCPVAYPAAYDQVIAVSFTNTADKLTGFSCVGPQMDLAAPGNQIASTVPVGTCMFCSPNGYRFESGTYMASPHVAGVVALTLGYGIADANGDGLLADDVKAHLCATASTASSPAPTDPKYAKWYGCGIVDADRALVLDPPAGGGTGNHPPSAAGDTASVAEDAGPTVVDVLANDTDADAGDTLIVTAVTDPARGTATTDGASVTYTPDPDANGTDTFGYTISDGAGGNATAMVTVTVSAVDDPPIAVDDTASLPEGGSVSVDVLANDTDIDGGALHVVAVSDPSRGSASIDPGGASVTYTADPGASGSDAFSYTVDDGAGGTDEGSVAVTIVAASAPPVAGDDAASTNEDTPVTIDVLANDSDPDGDPLTVTQVSDPAQGAVTIGAGGSIMYTPDANTSGTDLFTYTVADDAFGTDQATVTVEVASVNDLPTAGAASSSGAAPSAITVSLTGTDVETCELDFAIVAMPANGALGSIGAAACTTGVPNADRATVAYTPNPGFIGSDSFTYRTSDGADGSPVATATVTVTVPTNGLHMGDLDNSSIKNANSWVPKVTVTIHRTNETGAVGAVITGVWSDGTSGTSTCTGNSNGRCTLAATGLSRVTTPSVRFTVTNVTLSGWTYLPSLNHDVDGNSNGTTIVVMPK